MNSEQGLLWAVMRARNDWRAWRHRRSGERGRHAAIWLGGLAAMLLIGLVVGALHARRGMRLRIVDALAGR